MKAENPIWLASYPRSGNTLIRTVLWQCFGLKSGSVYPNDLGGNSSLESYVGHVEFSSTETLKLSDDAPTIIKTHERPASQHPAIYIVRDGRAATVSLWEFYSRKVPLTTIIQGQHRFGTWAQHLIAWKPWKREGTLFLRYEDIISSLPATLDRISEFLDLPVLSTSLPDREDIAQQDGRWVRQKTDWSLVIDKQQLDTFYQLNGSMMRKLRYRK